MREPGKPAAFRANVDLASVDLVAAASNNSIRTFATAPCLDSVDLFALMVCSLITSRINQHKLSCAFLE